MVNPYVRFRVTYTVAGANVTPNRSIASTASGYCIVQSSTGADTTGGYVICLNGAPYNITHSSTGSATAGNAGVGVTGYNMPVVYATLLASTYTATFQSAASIGVASTASTTLGATFFAGTSASIPQIAPSFGYNFVVVYRNASNFPTFAIISQASVAQFGYLAGTESSAPLPIYPGTTVTTASVSHTVFVGVAKVAASGQVQTNGSAQLNTSYTPAATYSQGFDSTGQAVQGARGTMLGNSVVIQGNT
jgi:hypothetical protein